MGLFIASFFFQNSAWASAGDGGAVDVDWFMDDRQAGYDHIGLLIIDLHDAVLRMDRAMILIAKKTTTQTDQMSTKEKDAEKNQL